MKKIALFSFVFFLFLMACNHQSKPKMVVYSGEVQGTTFHIKYFADQSIDTIAINNSIDSIFKLVDKTASVYDSTSIISQINKNIQVKLNAPFIELFNLSQQVSDNSDGYFDITVGPLVRSWGFFKKKGLDLSKKQVDSLLQYIGYKKIQIKNDILVKESPGVIIDLNAIAQGYTDDLVANLFIQKGIKNYLIEIGGEVRASGTKENQVLWMVGIEKPAADENAEQVIQDKVQLKDLSLATSGNYRKYFIKDGVKYSHTIDPKTGYPVHHSLLSVTVVANTCALADAYATAFMVMGLDKAKTTLAKHPEMQAYFIYSDSLGNYKTEYTKGFENLLAK